MEISGKLRARALRNRSSQQQGREGFSEGSQRSRRYQMSNFAVKKKAGLTHFKMKG